MVLTDAARRSSRGKAIIESQLTRAAHIEMSGHQFTAHCKLAAHINSAHSQLTYLTIQPLDKDIKNG